MRSTLSRADVRRLTPRVAPPSGRCVTPVEPAGTRRRARRPSEPQPCRRTFEDRARSRRREGRMRLGPAEGSPGANHQTDQPQTERLTDDPRLDIARGGAERHADADLLRPLADRVRDQRVDAERCEDQREDGKATQQKHGEATRRRPIDRRSAAACGSRCWPGSAQSARAPRAAWWPPDQAGASSAPPGRHRRGRRTGARGCTSRCPRAAPARDAGRRRRLRRRGVPWSRSCRSSTCQSDPRRATTSSASVWLINMTGSLSGMSLAVEVASGQELHTQRCRDSLR